MSIRLVVVCAAASLIGSAALAQGLPEVKVVATRVVSSTISAKTAGRTASGIPIKDISLSYSVSSEGLDLATSSGALAFEQRVKGAAEQACKEIGYQHPEATPGDAECARVAADQALAKVHELVAAAVKSTSAAK